MSYADYLASVRSRGHRRRKINHPGTIQFTDIEGSAPLAASVVIGTGEMEITEGNFVRTQAASITIAKCLLPTIPDLETRPPIQIVRPGAKTETYSIVEHHDQDANTWFIRAVKWGN